MLTIKGDRRSGKTSALVALYRLDPENSIIIVPYGMGAKLLTREHNISPSRVISVNAALNVLVGSQAKVLIDNADAIDPVLLKQLHIFNVIAEAWNDYSFPSYGDRYFYLGVNGTIDNEVWHGDDVDREQYEFGNVFTTSEEADYAKDRVREQLVLVRSRREETTK